MKLEYIFAAFAILGALDKMTGNRLKLGGEFEKGIMTVGVLVMSMSGTLVLAPVLGKALGAVFSPLAELMNIDVAVAASFIANDSGGAVMAYEMSEDPQMRAYHGLVVASMFGATVCPVVPLALQIVDKRFHDDVLTGLLCGIATIPVGCLIGGMVMKIPFCPLLRNTVPMILISGIICLGLWKAPDLTRKIFGGFGKFLSALILAGLALGILEQLTGLCPIPGTAPLSESFVVIGNIAVILAGAFPMLAILSRLFGKGFRKLGGAMGISETSVLGFVTTLANSVPMMSMMEKMDKKGRVLNMAFAVSAGFVFGDHLAFTLAFDGQYALPVTLGKLAGAVAALGLASFLYGRTAEQKFDAVQEINGR